jgi:hypothetical protein
MRHAAAVRSVLLVLLLLPLLTGEEVVPTLFIFDETIAGRPSPSADKTVVEAITQYHRERLARARAELPAATPLMARLIRADIGSMDAEMERLAVVAGKTLQVGRRVFTVKPDRITMESPAEGTRIDVDPASGRGTTISGLGSDPVAVQMASPPQPVPLSKGTPGPVVIGRPTLRFEVSAEGRAYIVLVDPTLANGMSWLVPREGEDAAITLELAKLPGMPLDISTDSGDFVRRFTCVEAK